jgi:Bacterial flagellin N-terminal helical region
MLRQSVLQMQSDLTTGETELSTGNYADPGVTLGAGVGESISLQSETSVLQTITNTNQMVTTRLNTTQTILANLQSSAQDLLNSLLQGNGSNSNAASIQALGQSNLQNLISSLNRHSPDGSYRSSVCANLTFPARPNSRRRARGPLAEPKCCAARRGRRSDRDQDAPLLSIGLERIAHDRFTRVPHWAAAAIAR